MKVITVIKKLSESILDSCILRLLFNVNVFCRLLTSVFVSHSILIMLCMYMCTLSQILRYRYNNIIYAIYFFLELFNTKDYILVTIDDQNRENV